MKTFGSSLIMLALIGVICKIICKVYGISVKSRNLPILNHMSVITQQNDCKQKEEIINTCCENDEELEYSTVVINQNVLQVLNHLDGSVKNEIPLPVIPLKGLILGKAKDADIRIDEDVISRHHCILGEDENGLFIVDKGSTNGIYYPSNLKKRVKGIDIKIGEIFYIANIPVRICLRNQMEPICETNHSTKVFRKNSSRAEEVLARA